MNQNASNLLKRHPLPFFFILAYGIAWIPMILLLVTGKNFLIGISFVAPAISAVIVAMAGEGKVGVQALVSRLFLWRIGFKWYLVALLAPIVLELLAILTHALLGDITASLHFNDWATTLPTQLPALAIVLLFLVAMASGEELGWRGYALPRLQAQYGSVWASLILGLLWGLWHLPTFWVAGSSQFGLPIPGYILATIGFAFIYTCIHNGAKGSVLLASLYHAASNLTLTYGNTIFPQVTRNLYLSLPALAVLVIGVIVISGPGGLTGKQPFPNQDTA